MEDSKMVVIGQSELREMIREVVQKEISCIPNPVQIQKDNEDDPALTIKKAAQISGYETATLYTYACQGKLPTFKNKGKLFILRSNLYKFMGKPQ